MPATLSLLTRPDVRAHPPAPAAPSFLPASLTLPTAMDCALNSGAQINSSPIEFRLVSCVVTAREN